MADAQTPKWSGPVYTVGRYALTMAGTAIAVLGAVGWIDQAGAAKATQAIQSIADSVGTIAASVATLAGVGATLYATVRGALNSTASAQVAAVQAMATDRDSPVKGVVLDLTADGQDLKDSLPGPGIVLAGTPAAQSIVQAR